MEAVASHGMARQRVARKSPAARKRGREGLVLPFALADHALLLSPQQDRDQPEQMIRAVHTGSASIASYLLSLSHAHSFHCSAYVGSLSLIHLAFDGVPRWNRPEARNKGKGD